MGQQISKNQPLLDRIYLENLTPRYLASQVGAKNPESTMIYKTKKGLFSAF